MDAKRESRTTRTAPLAIDAKEFQRLGHELVDRIAGFLETLPERPVTPGELLPDVRALMDFEAPLPDQGEGASELLGSTAEMLFEHSLFNGHPRFLGYITSSPAPIGMLGDFLASAVNANVGGWRSSGTRVKRW